MKKTLELFYDYSRQTKPCCVYQNGDRAAGDLQTLYVKKDKLVEAGIPVGQPVKVTIEEA